MPVYHRVCLCWCTHNDAWFQFDDQCCQESCHTDSDNLLPQVIQKAWQWGGVSFTCVFLHISDPSAMFASDAVLTSHFVCHWRMFFICGMFVRQLRGFCLSHNIMFAHFLPNSTTLVCIWHFLVKLLYPCHFYFKEVQLFSCNMWPGLVKLQSFSPEGQRLFIKPFMKT